MPIHWWAVVVVGLAAAHFYCWRGPGMARAHQDRKLKFYGRFADIDFSGYRALVCDLENSVVERGIYSLGPAILAVFQRAQREGVQVVCLLSNKRFKGSARSGDFRFIREQLEDIGFDAVHLLQPGHGRWKWPRKPYRAAFRRALRYCGNPDPGTVLAIGDKVRFDVLRPIHMGCGAALVNPLGSDGRGDRWVLIRPFERLSLWWWGLSRAGQREPRTEWAIYGWLVFFLGALVWVVDRRFSSLLTALLALIMVAALAWALLLWAARVTLRDGA